MSRQRLLVTIVIAIAVIGAGAWLLWPTAKDATTSAATAGPYLVRLGGDASQGRRQHPRRRAIRERRPTARAGLGDIRTRHASNGPCDNTCRGHQGRCRALSRRRGPLDGGAVGDHRAHRGSRPGAPGGSERHHQRLMTREGKSAMTTTNEAERQEAGPPVSDAQGKLPAFVMLAGTLISLSGLAWDIGWHTDVGPDSFFTLPHLFVYSGGAIAGLTSLVMVLRATSAQRRGVDARPGRRRSGVQGARCLLGAHRLPDRWHRGGVVPVVRTVGRVVAQPVRVRRHHRLAAAPGLAELDLHDHHGHGDRVRRSPRTPLGSLRFDDRAGGVRLVLHHHQQRAGRHQPGLPGSTGTASPGWSSRLRAFCWVRESFPGVGRWAPG